MSSFVDRHVAFDHCKALLPWFHHARRNTPMARLRRWIATEEGKNNRPSAWLAAPLHLLTSLRQILVTWAENRRITLERFQVSPTRQFLDLCLLSWRYNYAAHDYYRMKFWLQPRNTWADYLPHREHMQVLKVLRERLPIDEFDDKLNLFLRLEAAGLPSIPVLGVARHGQWLPKPVFPPRPELLAQDLVIKPTDGCMFDGVQIWRLRPNKAYSRELTKPGPFGNIVTGECVLSEEGLFQHILELSKTRTILVQGRVHNSSDIQKVSPRNLANFRVLSYSTAEGIQIAAAVLRLAYDGTRIPAGCYLSPVERESGILGLATGNQFHWGHGPDHIHSDVRVAGHPCAAWPQLCELALRAHALFPWMPAIGWDLLDTTDGPMIMEANASWGADIIQVAQPFLGKTGYAEAMLEGLASA